MGFSRSRLVSIFNRRVIFWTNYEISEKFEWQMVRKNLPKLLNIKLSATISRSVLFSPIEIIKLYKIPVMGVLHIGAHKGDEADAYHEIGIKKATFIEPIKENYMELIKRLHKYPNYQALQVAAGDQNLETFMFLASNDLQSSSLLEPADHLEQNPEITFNSTEKVKMRRVDSLEISNELNYWVIDVQGFELSVLRGAGTKLENCDYAFVELNRANVYHGCVKFQELDEFLISKGFQRVLTRWWDIWGDGFYVRTTKLPLEMSLNDKA